MEELSRDVRSHLALFLPLPSMHRLRMCSKTLCKQWDEPLQRQLVACAKRLVDATSNDARLLLLFQTGLEGRFCFQVRSEGTSGRWWTQQGYHYGPWDEIRGWFVVCMDGNVELRSREQVLGRSFISPKGGVQSVFKAVASAALGPKTVTVSGLTQTPLDLVRVSHGPFSFSMVAFYKTQCEVLNKGIK